ncbi:N-methylhydantoinase B [Desulfofundulus luciae]|uniref:N-methylhydantoinase B n=1 Tax=Desulfofundulus luciae TaxID=74702 RepID=A0ABU0B0Q4_9FIRM|nr:hydantoinase B/oxoprolinase family protein [Desulfofundulus luciae]MDQ0286309.1 N-methylhydantoinase B [Desulfofundulus luciae]
MSQLDIDPVQLEVTRHVLQSVAEEMGAILTRTALSPNIKDRRDCSTAIYTADGRLVAQAEHIPLHLGLMPAVVQAVLREYPLAKLEDGDAVIINDPYISGSHLPDICVISPVFYRNRPLALVANLAHHVDVGGAVPGSMSTLATEIFQEGIRIPPVKIRRRGKINQELLKLVSHNLRTTREFHGDIQAQLTANDRGIKRLVELAERYGANALKQHMEQIISYTHRRLLAALEIIPPGTYEFEDFLEGDGLEEKPINIRVAVTRHGKGLTVDFSGTHPQVKGPVNATRGVTLACVYYVVKAVVDPDLPSSDGLNRAVEVVTPEGSLVNPVFPAPVAHANINTAQRIADVLLGALARAVPERVTAAGTGSMSNFTAGGVDPTTGTYYSYVETYGGGQGAKHNQDGMDGVHVHMTNTRNTPVEVIEQSYPLRVERYALVPDSGGAGKHRGGLGMVREITVLRGEATVAVSTERAKSPPWGLAGGLPGQRAMAGVVRQANPAFATPGLDGGSTGRLPAAVAVRTERYGIQESKGGKFTCRVPAGTTIILQTAGGGGYGHPLERNPELVRQDVLEGLVSRRAAEEVYGVVFSADLEVDYEATVRQRKKLRHKEQ